jgi:hypothetical protein
VQKEILKTKLNIKISILPVLNPVDWKVLINLEDLEIILYLSTTLLID